jgi:lysozyme
MTYITLNRAGQELIHEFEQFVGHAYPDPMSPLGKEMQKRGLWSKYLKQPFLLNESLLKLNGAPWTMGWGFTEGVHRGDSITRAEADARFVREVQPRLNRIITACTLLPNENQLAAMVSLAYNIGVDAFLKSTVLRCHNKGDFAAASRAFRLWNKSRGEVVAGLERRRAAEASLYLRPAPSPHVTAAVAAMTESTREMLDLPDPEPAPEVMPQIVDKESGFTESPVNRTAIATGTAALLEGGRTIADVRYTADSLGDWLLPVLLIVVACACGYLIYQRVKQRKGGWA